MSVPDIVPRVLPPIGRNDHSAIPAVSGTPNAQSGDGEYWLIAEGGFKPGGEAVVDLPGDDWHGKPVTLGSVMSERTILCQGPDDTRRYCVAALRHAP